MFIDYSKAFDTVGHEPLINLLQTVDMDNHGVQLLAVHNWVHDITVQISYTGNKKQQIITMVRIVNG